MFSEIIAVINNTAKIQGATIKVKDKKAPLFNEAVYGKRNTGNKVY